MAEADKYDDNAFRPDKKGEAKAAHDKAVNPPPEQEKPEREVIQFQKFSGPRPSPSGSMTYIKTAIDRETARKAELFRQQEREKRAEQAREMLQSRDNDRSRGD